MLRIESDFSLLDRREVDTKVKEFKGLVTLLINVFEISCNFSFKDGMYVSF